MGSSGGTATAVGAAGGDLAGNYPNPTVSKLGATTNTVAFYNGALTARPAAYTLTYAGLSRTLANDTAVNVSTTASTSVAPFGYSTQAQADAIPVAINAIRVDLDNVKNVLAQQTADFKANGLLA